MKGAHITLPTLQLAASAFFIAAAQAEEVNHDPKVTYCVDEGRQVVESENCDGSQPQGRFFYIRGLYDEDKPAGTNLTEAPHYFIDSSDIEARLAHGLDKRGAITRSGFGKRDMSNELYRRACASGEGIPARFGRGG
ncbi:hypothetical protein CDD82_6155 [Ophiocordyceps australis]|uniref:Uncharacterized protein n=1 Tax=Ophiocordyceps australis TaxID=1399860 RepID=A0A2C5ZRC7_9HYPO|nr:hypothetical protein CDD82_6155 [Ophiocordyceps australis]